MKAFFRRLHARYGRGGEAFRLLRPVSFILVPGRCADVYSAALAVTRLRC